MPLSRNLLAQQKHSRGFREKMGEAVAQPVRRRLFSAGCPHAYARGGARVRRRAGAAARGCGVARLLGKRPCWRA